MGVDVQFLKFLNKGNGLTGRDLGDTATLTYIQNGVEIQFSIPAEVKQKYKNLKPLQWAGPEVVWVKYALLGGTWISKSRSQGSGSDDPLPNNVKNAGSAIAYYDAPGPNMAVYISKPPARIYVVQNFTAWVIGYPIKGGPAERLCDVVAWHSIVSLANGDSDKAIPKWQRVYGNGSGIGWRDVSSPPKV